MTIDMPRRAMVLAAGLGKRMRPLTDTRPKPLLEVAGRSLLDRALDRLAEVPIERAVVNVHYLGDQIEAHLKTRTSPPIAISRESELLETGGGVVKALPLLGAAPFFAVNADVLWLDGAAPALQRMASAWDDSRMDVLLLMQSTAAARGYEGRGDYFLDALGRLRRRRSNEVAPYVYAAVQILHPRIFKDAPDGAFSLNRIYDKAEAAGRLWGIVHDGLWFHVGTPEDLAATELEFGGARRLAAGAEEREG
jgi:N-acetyl-alpha-D-muramate 1-phosphate uridylyltransferase